METEKVTPSICCYCVHRDAPGDGAPCMSCTIDSSRFEQAVKEEQTVDCNTCRHHVQGQPSHETVYCAMCLADFALNGELSGYQRQRDPNNEIEA